MRTLASSQYQAQPVQDVCITGSLCVRGSCSANPPKSKIGELCYGTGGSLLRTCRSLTDDAQSATPILMSGKSITVSCSLRSENTRPTFWRQWQRMRRSRCARRFAYALHQ